MSAETADPPGFGLPVKLRSKELTLGDEAVSKYVEPGSIDLRMDEFGFWRLTITLTVVPE